jgi:type IV secretory pathway VirB3-like protein
MKIPVLKALANPARIFFVPYNLAVLNFAVLFAAWLAIFFGGLVLTGGELGINPLYFLLSLIGSHMMLAVWSKREPFLAKILVARIRLWRMPGRMAA